MEIGILGTGAMGTGLGNAWARAGHSVMFGSRRYERAAEVAAEAGPNAKGGTIAEAAAFGDAVLLAVRWAHIDDTLEAAGSLEGKILMDCTNPLSPDFMTLLIGHTDSGSEQIAERAKGARIVKVFNHVYAPVIQEGPRFGDRSASVFYCGDDAEAKATVARLAADIGFHPVDAGALTNARFLEPLAEQMVQLAYVVGAGTDQALSMVQR